MVERLFHDMGFPVHMITAAPTPGTQSIDRAAQLLVHVLETGEPPTVGELSDRSGLPKSTTSRLVAALERQGLVQREPARGTLVAGPVLRAYARRQAPSGDIVALAADSLDRLARISGETVNLGVAGATTVDMVDQRDSRHILGSANWVGRRVAPHVSVVGKVFLAEGEMPFPQGALEPAGPRSITDPDELRAELELTQARGYATALDELEPGLWAVAAPVRDASGRVVAALSVSGPTVRLEEGQLEELGQLVRDEAVVLSTRNGYDTKRGAA
jgi:IclR family transcriptional regulator, acetate operon repressor